MSKLEEQIHQLAEKAVLKIIGEGGWVMPDYQNRIQLPKEMMQQVWELVDVQKIKAKMAERIEAELADRIVNHLAAEMATDIKQILSVQERREALREIARKHVVAVMKLGADPA